MSGWRDRKKRPRLRAAGPYGAEGFTLFELLVAMAVFALMATALYTGLNSLVSNADALEKSSSVYEAARICLDRIARDLESVYVSQKPAYKVPDFAAEPDPYRFVADSNAGEARIRFVAFSHLASSNGINVRAGRIIYYMNRRPGSETGEILRNDTILQYEARTDSGKDPVLCENVGSFELSFYDENGNEFDRWDSESPEFGYSTPRLVKIRIVIREGGRSYPFETMVSLPVYRERVD